MIKFDISLATRNALSISRCWFSRRHAFWAVSRRQVNHSKAWNETILVNFDLVTKLRKYQFFWLDCYFEGSAGGGCDDLKHPFEAGTFWIINQVQNGSVHVQITLKHRFTCLFFIGKQKRIHYQLFLLSLRSYPIIAVFLQIASVDFDHVIRGEIVQFFSSVISAPPAVVAFWFCHVCDDGVLTER